MKKRLLIAILSVSSITFSQKKDKVLMTIGNEKVLVSDFIRVYEKNLDAIDNEEEKEKYLSELAKKYGNGIHREQFKEAKRIIDYVVVVKDGKADEYKKIKYDWGGLYYFKNGKSTSSAIYITETK